jgi:hypothetical protein
MTKQMSSLFVGIDAFCLLKARAEQFEAMYTYKTVPADISETGTKFLIS